LAKQAKPSAIAQTGVRTRRAYFDCRFGQLHVRTAFPATGGFDEQVTLFCLHSGEGSSRIFQRFLAEIADERSVYAPDLPGCGESDSPAQRSSADAAASISDLANDLRLRQIDVLGYRHGAEVAVELSVARPELVRRLVLVGIPPLEGMAVVKHRSLVLRNGIEPPGAMQRAKGLLPNAQFVDAGEHAEDLFDAAPKVLAKQIAEFLKR